MLQPVFADVGDGGLVDVFQFQLQFQQLQQVVLVVGLVHTLHQRGLALTFLRIGFAVGMKDARKLAVNLANRLAERLRFGLLLRLFGELFGRFCAFGLARCFPRQPVGVFLRRLLFEPDPRTCENFFRRGEAEIVAQLETQLVLKHGLHALQVRGRFDVEVGAAVLVVEGFQVRIVALRGEFPRQPGNHLRDLLALVFG